jgi:hypothetical protein
LGHGEPEITGDDHHARLGEDALQLVDQIGFLRTIHANSIFRPKQASSEVQQKPGQMPKQFVSVGRWIDGAANMQRTTKRLPLRLIPVPVSAAD